MARRNGFTSQGVFSVCSVAVAGVVRRVIPGSVVLGLALLPVLALHSTSARAQASAQKATPSVPRSTGGGSVGNGGNSGSGNTSSNHFPNYGDPSGSETETRLEELRRHARETERQKRMVEDANRLVALAARYRAQVSEHGSPTAEDTRLLAEMEKLARSVKDRMRGM